MSEPERKSLANAFAVAPVDRSEGLGGLLPPRKKPATAPASNTADAAATETVTAEVESPRPSRREVKPNRAEPAKPASAASGGAIHNVPAYLPPELRATVRRVLRERETTYADLLVEGFEEVAESALQDLFKPSTNTTNGKTMPVRQRRPRGDGGIQVQLRLDGLQTEWLDQKVLELGAPSRSALVAAVYKLMMERQAK